MRYRTLVKRRGNHSWVQIQIKVKWYKRWANLQTYDSLSQAESAIKRFSDGVVITAVYDYDESGERINDCCW